MWARACTAGGPAPWVRGDRVDGEDRRRRLWLAAHRQASGLVGSGQESVWRRGRLGRRRLSPPTELTADGVVAAQAPTLEAVVPGAGRRGSIDSGVEAATGAGGWDPDDVRRWTGWDRPITLARGALARLTIWRAGPLAGEAFKKRPDSTGFSGKISTY
jgi:hypothetical protein